MAQRCVSCGIELPEGATSCPQCGAAVATRALLAPTAGVRAEARQSVIVVAIVMALPAAILLNLLVLVLSGAAVHGLWLSLVGVLVFPFFFAHAALHRRTPLRRGLLTVAVEAFCVPLAALVYTIILGSSLAARGSIAAAAIGMGIGGFVLVFFGIAVAVVVGVPSLIAYFALDPAGPPVLGR